MFRRGQGKQQVQAQVSIFRTQCLSQGKICKVIVDSSSFDNIVSQEMVEKFNLMRMPHSRPYKATWVTYDQHLVVQEQFYVYFSIGAYHDRVLCDVVPMTCCHFLLGRPWQYQRRTLHDGYNNTYVVHKDGKKFTLTPLKINHIFEPRVI